jgi:hypothetical protein
LALIHQELQRLEEEPRPLERLIALRVTQLNAMVRSAEAHVGPYEQIDWETWFLGRGPTMPYRRPTWMSDSDNEDGGGDDNEDEEEEDDDEEGEDDAHGDDNEDGGPTEEELLERTRKDRLPTVEEILERTRRIELDDECAICLREYAAGDVLAASGAGRGGCPHSFHRDCVVDWIRTGKSTCPICRRKFLGPPTPVAPPVGSFP